MATSAANGAVANGVAATHAAAAAGGEAATLQLLHEFLRVQSARAGVYARFNQGFRDFLEHGQEAAFARLMQEVTPAFDAASQQVIAIESALKSAGVARPDLAALLRRVQEGERHKLKLTLSWQALRAAHAAGQFSWQEAADRPHATSAARSSRQQAQQVQQQQALLALMQQVGLEGGDSSQQHGSDTRASAARDQGAAAAGDGHPVAIKPGFYTEQMQRAVEGAVAAEAAASGGAGSSSNNSSRQQQQQHACHHHRHHGCSHHGHGDECREADPLEPTEAEYTAAVRECWQELDACVQRINEALEEVRDAMEQL